MTDIGLIDAASHDAFYKWYLTGDRSMLAALLRGPAPLIREDRLLLAAIISGDWKRPKVPGRENRGKEYWRDEIARYRVDAEKSAAIARCERDAYRAALERVAPDYGLSLDGLDKRLRPSRRTSPYRMYLEAVAAILANR